MPDKCEWDWWAVGFQILGVREMQAVFRLAWSHGLQSQRFTCHVLTSLKWLYAAYQQIHFSRWKDILERTLADLDREIAGLSESKDALENSLEAKNLPTEVNIENLVTREGRQDIDVGCWWGEDQLRKVRVTCSQVDP